MIVSTRGKICSSFIRKNASIAGCVSRNVRWRQSSLTPSPGPRSGSSSTPTMQKLGPISRSSATLPQIQKNGKGSRISLNISRQIQAKVTSTRCRVLRLSVVNGPPRSLMNTTSNRSRKGSPTFAARWAVHISRECQPSLAAIATSECDVCFTPPKADMCSALAHVCFGPLADIASLSLPAEW